MKFSIVKLSIGIDNLFDTIAGSLASKSSLIISSISKKNTCSSFSNFDKSGRLYFAFVVIEFAPATTVKSTEVFSSPTLLLIEIDNGSYATSKSFSAVTESLINSSRFFLPVRFLSIYLVTLLIILPLISQILV